MEQHRSSNIIRETKETSVDLTIDLDGKGRTDITTGIGFFDHMLNLFGAHGRFDLVVNCEGDIQVDGHHTVEDIGIALGQAVSKALGDKRGITRYGTFFLPFYSHILWFITKYCFLSKISFEQADTFATTNIYCRKNYHILLSHQKPIIYISIKFFKTCSPTSPDFSGWNWVAITLSLATAAVSFSPYSVVAVIILASSGTQ